jgi:hypothetical protein
LPLTSLPCMTGCISSCTFLWQRLLLGSTIAFCLHQEAMISQNNNSKHQLFQCNGFSTGLIQNSYYIQDSEMVSKGFCHLVGQDIHNNKACAILVISSPGSMNPMLVV